MEGRIPRKPGLGSVPSRWESCLATSKEEEKERRLAGGVTVSAEKERKGGRRTGLGRERGLGQAAAATLGCRSGPSAAGPPGRGRRKGEGEEGLRAKSSGGRVFVFLLFFYSKTIFTSFQNISNHLDF